MRLLIAFLCILAVIGCSQEAQTEYAMPVDYEQQSFEFTHGNGYAALYVEYSHGQEPYDAFAQWEAWRERHEALDKYSMARAVAEKEVELFHVKEEKRIEEYCEEWGYGACKDIKYTCEEDGCHVVTVECDDDFYDEGLDDYSECRKFEVEVQEDINDEVTESVEEEEI
jgi:hypothetical protein